MIARIWWVGQRVHLYTRPDIRGTIASPAAGGTIAVRWDRGGLRLQADADLEPLDPDGEAGPFDGVAPILVAAGAVVASAVIVILRGF